MITPARRQCVLPILWAVVCGHGLVFADAFDRQFVSQGEDEDRSIIETLNLAWELLSLFSNDALSRVSETDIAKYHHSGKK